ncbi:MAG: lipase maturation factor family protein [Verrucomicrobiota bacterium]
MNSRARVQRPPEKPLLVYDGDCGFCKRWVARWQQWIGDKLECQPAQDPALKERFPEIPEEEYRRSVQLIETDGHVFSGAEAVFRSLALNPGLRWFLWWYENMPGFRTTSEAAYAFVARHRMLASKATRWFLPDEPPEYDRVRALFLRGLGAVYLVAFVSLWIQIIGLIGANGIQPAQDFMQAVRSQIGGLDGWLKVPTFCWVSVTDRALHVQCAAGAVLALLLMLGWAPRYALIGLWMLYLSLSSVSHVFLWFQWDSLLLETGLLAIFFAPAGWRLRNAQRPSILFLFLLRWLLFRLMFESGVVKLLSGDATWTGLTALKFHYETQPLPTPVGWYAHQLPEGCQTLSVLIMFAIELIIPFLIFGPRRARLIAIGPLAGLQLLIALTGNYCFFNCLTVLLCVPLLDDRALAGLIPKAWRGRDAQLSRSGTKPMAESNRVPAVLFLLKPLAMVLRGALAAWIFFITAIELVQTFRPGKSLPAFMEKQIDFQQPFRSLNSYGLFRVMTTTRPEIIIEGSNDGEQWLTYEFKYKPGALTRPPVWAAPHQPRLDWQMWFAALGDYRRNPWFMNFCARLLQGAPEVLALLKTNPFPNQPPRHLRAFVYEYRFTNFAERRATGQWWKREFKGSYCPVLTLRKNQNDSSAER